MELHVFRRSLCFVSLVIVSIKNILGFIIFNFVCFIRFKYKFGFYCYCMLSVIDNEMVSRVNTLVSRFFEHSKVEWSITGSQPPGIKRYPRGAPKEIHILSKVVINETFPVDDKWKSVYETTNLILNWLNTSWFHGNLILFVAVKLNWSYLISAKNLITECAV